VAAFEHELHALTACAGGKFLRGTIASSVNCNIYFMELLTSIASCIIAGSLREMDEMLESCLTVHSGISNQYLYRSLYGVQIQNCLKVIMSTELLNVC
jgi:hypothetical protein